MRTYLYLLFVTFSITIYLTTNTYGQTTAFQKITEYVADETNAGKKVTANDLETLFKSKEITDTIIYGKESNPNYAGLAELSVAALDSTHFVFAYRKTGKPDNGEKDNGIAKIGEISGNSIKYGPQYTFNFGPTFSISVASLSDTSFIIAFQDSYNSDYGTVVKGTLLKNNQIEFGYNAVFNEGLTTNISIAGLSGDNFIVAYRNGGNMGYGTAKAGNATYGYSTPFGDAVIFNQGNTFDVSVKSSDGINAIITYRDNDDSDLGHVTIANITGNKITYGVDIPFNPTAASDISLDTFNDSTFVIAYRDALNSGFCITCNMTFPQITLGQAFPFNTTPVSDISLSVIDDTSFMIAYCDSSANNTGAVKIIDNNGVVLNYGPAAPLFLNEAVSNIAITTLNTENFVIAYEDSDDIGMALTGKTINNSITYGTDSPIHFGVSSSHSISALDETHFVLVYSDMSNSGYGTAVIGEVAGDTIQYGQKYVFCDKPVNESVVTALDPTHFAVAYIDTRNNFAGILQIGTVAGTTMAFGDKQPFDKTAKSLAISKLDDNVFVLAYVSIATDNVQSVASICQVTGTTISSGLNYGFRRGEVQHIAVEPITTSSFIITFEDIDSSFAGVSVIGEVVGTEINYGDEVVFNSAYTTSVSVSTLNPLEILIAFSDGNNSNAGTLLLGTVNGNSIIYAPPLIFHSEQTKYISIQSLDITKFLIVANVSRNDYLSTALPTATYIGQVIGGQIELKPVRGFYENALGYQNTFVTRLFTEGEESKIVIGYMDSNTRTGATKIGWINPSTVLVEKNEKHIMKYNLYQNYPNPFNPTTTINYSIPSVQTGHTLSVQLIIYDILGREVATLVNKKQTPGNYSVVFNASNLASGVYFYQLSVGNFVDVKKMMFIK